MVIKAVQNKLVFLHNVQLPFDRCVKNDHFRSIIKRTTRQQMPPRRFKISDESLNSYKFWVLTKGIELPPNGFAPVFYNHETRNLPIGKAFNFKVEGDNSLTADVEFDQNDVFALDVEKKVDGGFISGCSINILVKETSNKKEFLKPNQTKATVTASRLLELSIAPIPSNGNAIKLSNGTGDAFDLPEVIVESKEEQQMKTLKDLLKEKGLQLSALGLTENSTEDEIMKAIEKLAGQHSTATPTTAPEKTVEEKLTDKVISYGKLTGVVTNDNEANFRKLALADADATMNVIETFSKANAQKETPKQETPATTKGSGDTEKIAKLSQMLDSLKATTTVPVKEEPPKTEKLTFEQRVYKAANKS